MIFHYNLIKLIGGKIHNKKIRGIVPTEEDYRNAVKYDRVVIWGVDGAGGAFEYYDTPNFDRIFRHGSVSYKAWSQYPTISAENWTSILHGVMAQTHRITNEIAGTRNFNKKGMPSVFKVCSDNDPSSVYASIVNWFPINKGSIEGNIRGMYKINAGEVYKGPDDTYAVDQTVSNLVREFIQDKDPKILFTHFDGPDHAAHQHKFNSPEFEQAVKNSDRLIGEMYDAYCAKGWEKSTLFIVVSDHGQTNTPTGGKHGGWTPEERYVTIAVAGEKGNIIEGTLGDASTADVAAIALYGLGEKFPDSFECSVPENVFNTLKK